MKHILRFFRFVKAVLIILCVLIIASAVFPGVFSWSTAEGQEQIQDFVENVRESANQVLEKVSERTGLFREKDSRTDTPAGGSQDYGETEGRADYAAPEEKGQELAEDQAVDTDYGDTGAENEFDTLYYPYYGILTEDEQRLYKQLYANMMNRNAEFDLEIKTDRESLSRVFEAVCSDHPEIFWLETSYQYGYYGSGVVAKVILNFNETAEYYEQASSLFTAAAQEIIQGASAYENSIDKERYVHDALNEQTEYDENSSLNQSAYSALVNGSSVCAGYSRAFQYLMLQLGIPCYYCTGYAGGEHAWNVVSIDGNYYFVDVSWDDGLQNPYKYFHVPEEEFFTTHSLTGLSEELFLSLSGG